jgi:hydroxyacylglutathione hydrolase
MPALKAAIVPVTPFQQNCTLLWDEESGRGVVIDPGGDVERILAAIRQQGIQVETILLTHGHIDHAGGAAALRDVLKERARGEGDAEPAAVPIVGPGERDRFLLEGLEQQGRALGLAGARDVLPDRWLQDGDEVRIAGDAFAVLHCPGHTPGHIVLVNAAARFAILGDVLFRGSVGRTDLPGADHATLLESIATLLSALPDETRVLPGHMGATTLGRERATNPFLHELA